MKRSIKQQGTLFTTGDPEQGVLGIEFVQGRTLGLSDAVRLAFARSFTCELVRKYWHAVQRSTHEKLSLKSLRNSVPLKELHSGDIKKADDLSERFAELPILEAGYRIGCIYTAALPDKYRSERGVFYTPPGLCQRLVEIATEAGTDWSRARVLDPACGGAAFLAPVALRMASELRSENERDIVYSISSRLAGLEIDPFAAWLSQTLVEVALMDLCRRANCRLPQIAFVQDSLSYQCNGQGAFDLVIGNPPYGRVRLSTPMRLGFKRSLFGHANLYGLFTDKAVQCLRANGIVAFVTPTSMLGGEYHKNLRRLLTKEAPPVSIDFVAARCGVFEDVLQETMLAAYRFGGAKAGVRVSFIELADGQTAKADDARTFRLPKDGSQPWLLPRNQDQSSLVTRLAEMETRIASYGYQVSTGPLVWNRHKGQLQGNRSRGTYPVVWAESISSKGRFEWRAEKRNHLPWLWPGEKDRWVLTNRPCVLVQRTTAKEQNRRLIAAEMPAVFVRRCGYVAVENHLNMVWTDMDHPPVSAKLIAALFNCAVVDSAFRCINGSVAVSAYELEALPLPCLEDAVELDRLLERRVSKEEFEEAVTGFYKGKSHAAATVA
jgi:adenine-specific DNA-methyltransferase